MAGNQVRVLIADDERLFAEALEAILTTDERIDVVGRAANGEEAVALARDDRPDVVLMDIAMPVLDGIAATEAIGREAPRHPRRRADRLGRAGGHHPRPRGRRRAAT